jgi:tRNA pseudouridine synthase 10
MTITAEGGLPIKRFIAGGDISPNISTLFDTPCMAQEFDFLDIIVE